MATGFGSYRWRRSGEESDALIAQRIDRLLQAEGMSTVMTRSGDAYASLAERAALTN